MMDNERRADLGQLAVISAAHITNVARVESAQTAITDVLAYIAHLCDRYGLSAGVVFSDGLASYEGDAEDGPPAARTLDPEDPLIDDVLDRMLRERATGPRSSEPGED